MFCRCDVLNMRMSLTTKTCSVFATVAIISGLIACGSFASNGSSSNQAAAARRTTVEFVRDLLISPNPQKLCSLLSPAALRKYGGSKVKCVGAFTFILALYDALVDSNVKLKAYVSQCFVASREAILIAPVNIRGNTVTLLFHPQGVPPEEKVGSTSVYCKGGDAHLVRGRKDWLVTSVPSTP
jgi:hypothetical protein